MKARQGIELVTAVIICEAAGLLGSVFTFSAIPTWYASLVKPPLNPPSWIFGPVWTTLYALMGIAAFLVWQKRAKDKKADEALRVFALQLALNALWSILFFGIHQAGLAFLEIVLMWLAIVWTMIAFYRISKPAAYLLAPYILWVSFAAYLNFALWFLNR